MSLNSTSGDAAAESYASVAEADAYFSKRNLTAWTGSDAAKEAALRLGTQFLDNAYRGKWVGLTAAQTQALAWPRVDGSRNPYHYSLTFPIVDVNGFQIDSTVVPAQVKYAAMEAALLALSGTALEPTLARGGQIKSIDKSVGPLRKAIVYADGAPVRDVYTVIDGYLRGLVQATGNVQLVRA